MNNEVYQLAGKLRATYQKKINNTYIWTSIAFSAIDEVSKNDDFLIKENFKVPSNRAKVNTIKKNKNINRSKEELSKILTTALEEDFNYSILTYIVAQVEAFFNELTYGILKIDKRKLKTRIQGINHTMSINVDDIINATEIDDLIDDLINRELISIFYASPKKQLEYLKKVLDMPFDNKLENLFNHWIELKASRDIIVHSSGIINDIYLNKSGDYSRGKKGEKLIINTEYRNSLIANSKSLVGKLCSVLQQHNKRSASADVGIWDKDI